MLKVFAMMMILVFPIGFPVFMWLLLFNNRFAISKRTERTGGPELETFAFLFRNYAPGTHSPRHLFLRHQPNFTGGPTAVSSYTPTHHIHQLRTDFWYMSVVDLARRLMLSSLLLAITTKSYQILFALIVSIIFVVLYREIGP